MTSILPVARSGVDQLAGSLPAELTVGVNLDEIIYPCSEVRGRLDRTSHDPRCSGERYLWQPHQKRMA